MWINKGARFETAAPFVKGGSQTEHGHAKPIAWGIFSGSHIIFVQVRNTRYDAHALA